MEKVLVAPSILSGDFAYMGDAVKNVEVWGADWVHCDVMDGVYVPNLTFGMPMVKAIRRITELTFDVHLMITKPEKYVQRFIDSGADIITFHPEASDNPGEVLDIIHNAGKLGGIALNPNVKIEDYEYLFPKCDIVTIMTVYAGYGGQKLIPECLDRIKYVKSRIGENTKYLEADGGVTEENCKDVASCGANVLVAGSAVFKSNNPGNTIKIIQNCKL